MRCTVKILVVDDHPLVRKGIISSLAYEKDIKEIMEASGIDEAMGLISKSNPEITIVDLYLGKEDGLELIKKAKQNHLDSKFIVLTSSLKRDDFERAHNLNVDGYILKDAFTEDIVYAFKVIARGKKFYDSTIVQCKLREEGKQLLDELTAREIEVFKDLAKGYSNRKIAESLYLSENTVKKHISSILDKLQLNHRTEAALVANKELNQSFQ